MKSETLEWLSDKAPMFGELPEREKLSIMDFALLWSFFESRCLGNNANMAQIRAYVEQLPEGSNADHEVEEIASFFRARYTENGEFSHRYHHLHLDRSGNPQEVSSMLHGSAGRREA